MGDPQSLTGSTHEEAEKALGEALGVIKDKQLPHRKSKRIFEYLVVVEEAIAADLLNTLP